MLRWIDWSVIFSNRPKKGLERWALRALHSNKSLRDIANHISKHLSTNGHISLLSIDSIWIDGTPQAVGVCANRKSTKSELGDILLAINVIDSRAGSSKMNALIIQAKVSDNHNKLSATPSTAKEVALFYDLDTTKDLVLYTGTQLTSRKIGTYTLNFGIGLQNGATFLNMPRKASWMDIGQQKNAFLCGNIMSKKPYMIKGIDSYSKVLSKFSNFQIGKPVVDPRSCEWSRMILDLLNNYRPVTMSGYGGQKRVISWLYSHAHSLTSISNVTLLSTAGIGNVGDREQVQDNGIPFINTIFITVVIDKE